MRAPVRLLHTSHVIHETLTASALNLVRPDTRMVPDRAGSQLHKHAIGIRPRLIHRGTGSIDRCDTAAAWRCAMRCVRGGDGRCEIEMSESDRDSRSEPNRATLRMPRMCVRNIVLDYSFLSDLAMRFIAECAARRMPARYAALSRVCAGIAPVFAFSADSV